MRRDCLNKMSLLTLPDFYYRRFGAGPEENPGMSSRDKFHCSCGWYFAAPGFILSLSYTLILSGQC